MKQDSVSHPFFKQLLNYKKRIQQKLSTSPKAIPVVLFMVAALLSVISLTGALAGYIYGYKRTMYPKKQWPRLYALPKAVINYMFIGFGLIWIALFLAIKILILLFPGILESQMLIYFMIANLILSFPVYVMFRRWRNSISSYFVKLDVYGSADFADKTIAMQYTGQPGFYIGGGLTFWEKGHLLLLGGARSGKGENIIMANLLGVGGKTNFSYVILDPKAELAAVTADSLRRQGKNVHILNPFNIFKELITGNCTFNPLDLVADRTSPDMIDDIQLLSELIVPIEPGESNPFWSSSARNVLAAILLHLAVNGDEGERTLGTLFSWLRRTGDSWNEMLADMAVCDDPVNGSALRNAASAIAGMMATPETFGSIMAHVYQCSDFLKSSTLQSNLVSGFNAESLAKGDTVLFITLPMDKMTAYANWLRLVVATTMRAVVRKPGERVCFLCDEASQLGFISEFPTCLSGYAGFNISLFLVYQDLSQIQRAYGESWQTVLANSTVKIATGIRENFSAEYLSEMSGDSTHTTYTRDWMGTISGVEINQRKLMTPEEIRRHSDKLIYLFIKGHPILPVEKFPYYLMPQLKGEDGSNLYNPNPYIQNSL